MKKKWKSKESTLLRTRVSSKSESVDVCTDNDANGYVEIANDDLGTNENVVVVSESERVVGMSRGGKR